MRNQITSRQIYVVIVVIIGVQQQNSVMHYVMFMIIQLHILQCIHKYVCPFNFNSTEVKSIVLCIYYCTLCKWLEQHLLC